MCFSYVSFFFSSIFTLIGSISVVLRSLVASVFYKFLSFLVKKIVIMRMEVRSTAVMMRGLKVCVDLN